MNLKWKKRRGKKLDLDTLIEQFKPRKSSKEDTSSMDDLQAELEAKFDELFGDAS